MKNRRNKSSLPFFKRSLVVTTPQENMFIFKTTSFKNFGAQRNFSTSVLVLLILDWLITKRGFSMRKISASSNDLFCVSQANEAEIFTVATVSSQFLPITDNLHLFDLLNSLRIGKPSFYLSSFYQSVNKLHLTNFWFP